MGQEIENAVDKETAAAEFDRFAEYWDICTDADVMTPETKEDFDLRRAQIIRLIQSGGIKINDEGQLIYTLRFSDTSEDLTFRVPKGSAYVAFDRYKERQNMAKTFEMIGAMTAKPPKYFSNIDGRDVKFCHGMLTLFMAS